jgi:hypothetical protein
VYISCREEGPDDRRDTAGSTTTTIRQPERDLGVGAGGFRLRLKQQVFGVSEQHLVHSRYLIGFSAVNNSGVSAVDNCGIANQGEQGATVSGA